MFVYKHVHRLNHSCTQSYFIGIHSLVLYSVLHTCIISLKITDILFQHNTFHALTFLNRSISLPEPSHSAVIGFVYVWYFFIDSFAVDHLDRRFTKESLLKLDQLFEESCIWSDLWPATNTNSKFKNKLNNPCEYCFLNN